MNRLLLLVVALASPALAAAATPQDYAQGIKISPNGDQPVQEIVLEDAVYAGVTRSNLSDLRLFNAARAPVPQALCEPESATLARAYVQMLRPIPITRAASADAPSTKIQIETSAAVTVEVQPDAPSDAAPEAAQRISAYVLDLGAQDLEDPVRALILDWQSPDGASEVPVRVLGGEDLEHWSTLAPQTLLVRAQSGNSPENVRLNQSRIAWPEARHRYLRIERADDGPALNLVSVTGEFVQHPPLPAPRSFQALAQGADAREPASYFFDAARLAPLISARVLLPEPNMALKVALDSRADAKASWQNQWLGEVFNLASEEAAARTPAIRFSATAHRYWRLRVLRGQDTLAGATPALELGYRPHRLRFLAQGAAPFLLAYGSARETSSAPLRCEDFLAGLSPDQLQAMTATTAVGDIAPAMEVGGEQALQAPPPPPRPLRQWLLWAVLALGAGAVSWMALHLLRRLREEP